jgi:DNA (cytosine-5)-methyltransferase 1
MAVPSQGLRLRTASLFAGAGGLDLGFRGGFSHLGVFYERFPYETVWAVDIDRDAELTWRANPDYLPVQAFVRRDIHDQDPDSVPDFDILLAGFPCQPFSNAGKRLGLVSKSTHQRTSALHQDKDLGPTSTPSTILGVAS